MSKYIKLEDAISKIVNTPTRVITDDLTALADRQHEIIDMLADLPTIEVSEDCISSEIWKPIPNFEGLYEASNIGRIRSVERKVSSGKGERTVSSKILKPILDEWGYEKVSLSKGGKCVSRKVNRLVAQAFIPNPNNYPQVNHKDGIKTHNYIENLEWCTASQNMKHCFENGMSDWQTKVKIIETGQVFNSLSECARAIGGHINNIQMCLKGRRKTHKGYHFEIVGDRASDKYGRNNYKENKQEYDSKVKIEHNGEVHSLREWSEILGIKLSTLTNRYYRGDRGERLFRTVIERDDAPSVVPRLDKEDLEDIKEHIAESYIEGYMDGQADGVDAIGDCNICRFAGCSECDDCLNGSQWVRMTKDDEVEE